MKSVVRIFILFVILVFSMQTNLSFAEPFGRNSGHGDSSNNSGQSAGGQFHGEGNNSPPPSSSSNNGGNNSNNNSQQSYSSPDSIYKKNLCVV